MPRGVYVRENARSTGYRCAECGTEDPNDFWESMRAKCKVCYSAFRRGYRRAKKDYLRELKESVPCMDCNTFYPHYVMDFDHRDPSLKEFELAKACDKSWSSLKAEVAKCDIVCANCHRQRTYERGGWDREDD